MGLGLGDIRIAPTAYPGFRLEGEVVRLSATATCTSDVVPDLSVTRKNSSTITGTSVITPRLSVSNEVYLDLILNAVSAITPDLSISRKMVSPIPGVSAINVLYGGTFKGMGSIALASQSTMSVFVFGEFVSDLETIRMSPMASPGFDFFVDAPADAPLFGIIDNRSAINAILKRTRLLGSSTNAAQSAMSANFATDTNAFAATIASITTGAAAFRLVKKFDLVVIDGSSILVSLGDIIWPVTLPQSPLLEGYSYISGETRHITNMAVGPAKVRPKASYGIPTVTYPLILTTAQRSELEDFYETDLKNGERQFLIKLARETSYSRVRFTSPPSFSPITSVKWRTNLELEVLPI